MEASSSSPDGPTRGPIRVLTWNVHGFLGKGRAPDMERTLAVLARLAPDVAALQEIDGRTHLGRGREAFERLGARLGDHRAEARTIPRPGRDYGHVLWSRWPILSFEVVPLPGGTEPRAAIDAALDAPGGAIRVIAAHLSLSPRARLGQARLLAGRVAAGGMPTLLLGDLNEWRTGGPVHAALMGAFPVDARLASWPSRRPFARMDRLYATSGVEIVSARVDPSAALASDHLPLLCEVSPRGR